MSSVWQFYVVKENEPKLAVCISCKAEISRGGATTKTYNTTNLIRHLKNHHRADYAAFEASNQVKAKVASGSKEPASSPLFTFMSNEKSKATTRKLMEFMALDDQPFSVMEDPGFRNLMQHLSPRYNLPSRRYFSDVALPELFNEVSRCTRSLLEADAKTLSFTTDIWTSDVSLMSMLSLTAQWIDQQFERQQVLLRCKEMPGSHTAANLSVEFKAMLDQWNISHESVHVVLRDNARNMAKALDNANLKSLPCLAHTLQLVVNEGQLAQRSIADVAAIGRKIVGHFKHSSLAYSRLYDIQEQLNQPRKRLQQDVATRWNSTVYMLQSLLEQRRAIGVYAAENELPAAFTAHQWELVENVLTILAPFEELTKEISSSTASAADVIPAVTALKRLLEKQASTDRGVGTAKATLLEAVVRRFNNIEHEPLYSLATILDPRQVTNYCLFYP